MRRTLWFAAAAILAAGCVTGINKDSVSFQTLAGFDQYGKIRRVAVVPFGEYSVRGGEQTIMGIPHKVTEDNGKVMCDLFTAELKAWAPYTVIGPERTAEFFKKRKEKVWGILTPGEVQRVGSLFKADGLVMGQVRCCSVYRYRTHKNARVALDLVMADGVTGEPIWRGNFQLDQEGKPHEVARRGIKLLLDQMAQRMELPGGSEGKGRETDDFLSR